MGKENLDEYSNLITSNSFIFVEAFRACSISKRRGRPKKMQFNILQTKKMQSHDEKSKNLKQKFSFSDRILIRFAFFT